jgi:hypothetical protein
MLMQVMSCVSMSTSPLVRIWLVDTAGVVAGVHTNTLKHTQTHTNKHTHKHIYEHISTGQQGSSSSKASGGKTEAGHVRVGGLWVVAQTREFIGARVGAGARAGGGGGVSCLGGSGVSKLLSVPLWAVSSSASPSASATPPPEVREVAVKWGRDSVLVVCAAVEQGVVGGGRECDLGATNSQKSLYIDFM